MAKKLFVGGLPYSVTNDELQQIFAKFGTVTSAQVITDRFSGRSKGFGFVEMEEDDKVEEAIKQLNGSDMGGRKITVNVARPREERRPNNFGSGGRDFHKRY